MGKGRLRNLAGVGLTLAGLSAAAQPVLAHSGGGWGVPLIGGLVGGYAFKSLTDSIGSSHRGGGGGGSPTYAAPTYVVPPPQTVYVPVQPSGVGSVEARLNQLQTLLANGYISQSEYERRRQAIINGL